MSERKSARRAPTPKRFSDEDVEKKPARKSTLTTPGGGGSKVRVFLPFRARKPLLFFFVRRIRKFSLFFSLANVRGRVGCVVVVVVVETFFLDRERGASLSLSLSLFSSDGNVVADVFAVVVVMVVGLLLFPKIHFFDEKFATEIKHQSHDDDNNDRRERAKGWRATSERRRRRETTAPSSEEQQNQQQQHE